MQAIDKVSEGASCVDWIDKLGGFVESVWAIPIPAAWKVGKRFPK
jgi:hypothetical protein